MRGRNMRRIFKQIAIITSVMMMGTSLAGMRVNAAVQYASSPATIVYSTMASTASSLTESEAGATTIVMTDEENAVSIKESGVYVVTGTCNEGNIEVKKNTKGVTLILKNLTLKSTTTTPISLNKGSQVKVVISGTTNLTDAEDPSTESTNDDFGGAAIKVKAGADVYLTGTGTLNIDASSCKNGLKSNDDSSTAFVIDGPTININALNDGINAGYDLTILSGKITVNAGDDGIHADRILTIGSSSKSPTITVKSSVEAMEGTEVIILGGTIGLTASDDGINAANSDGTYSSEMDFLIDIEGGTIIVKAGTDGLDSNGNINLIAGSLTINSANNGGDAGIDFDGSCYVSSAFVLNNHSGVSMDSGQGQSNGQYGQNGQDGQIPERPDGQNGQSGQNGQMPERPDGQNGQSGQMPERPDGQNGQNSQIPENTDGTNSQQAVEQPEENSAIMPGEKVEDDSDGGFDHTYIVNEDGASVTLKKADVEAYGKVSIGYIDVNGQKIPVTGIANGAFKNNKSIKQVTIGSTVTTIGKNAFSGCSKLKKVTIKAGGKLTIGKNAFKNLKSGSVIKVTGKNKAYNKKKINSQINSALTVVK